MAAPRIVLAIDDEPGLRDTYQQYLSPKVATGGALDRLRKLKATQDGAAAPAAKKSLLPPDWELKVASGGEEAVEIAKATQAAGGEVCVVFCDMKMPPGIDGVETLIRLMRLFPHLRCGIVSAYNDRTVDEINAQFDVDHQDRWDFISKPFTEPEIRQKARMMISTWLKEESERKHRSGLQWLVKSTTDLASSEPTAAALSDALRKHVELIAPAPRWQWVPAAQAPQPPSPGATVLDFGFAADGGALTGEGDPHEVQFLQAYREAASAHAQRARAMRELADLNNNLELLVTKRTQELTDAKEIISRSEERMRKELQTAAAIQTALLPATWPSDCGFEFAAKVIPSAETAGDICGFIDAGHGEVAVYVCDVTGHGAAAALGTAIICGTMKAVELELKTNGTTAKLSPSAILNRLNQVILETMHGSLFATFFLAVLERESGRLRYASAGHEWPLIGRAAQTSIVPLLASPRLGDLPNPEYRELETPFATGDVLLLYTDGLTDVADRNGKPFDRVRLYKTLAQAPRSSAIGVASAIEAALQKLTGAATTAPEDDITYLIVRHA